MINLRTYKRGQGKYSRALAFGGIGALAVFGAVSLYNSLLFPPLNEPFPGGWGRVPGIDMDLTPALLIMLGAVTIIAVGLYWLNNRRKAVDFLIETEGELRKVAWPTQEEVISSSIVVVITVFIMGMFIFLSDLILQGIMRSFIYKIKF